MAVKDKHVWLRSLRGRSDLTHGDFRVLVLLSTYSDAKGRNAFPGARRLADAMGVKDADAIRSRLADLVARGYLSVTSGGTVKGGQRQASRYELLPAPTTGAEHRGSDPPTTGDENLGQPVPTTGRQHPGSGDPTNGDPDPRWSAPGDPPSSAPGVPPVLGTPPSDQASDQVSDQQHSVTRSAADPATDLPDDFTPNRANRAAALALGLDADALVEPFRRWAAGKRRRTWHRVFGAFINWIADGNALEDFQGS